MDLPQIKENLKETDPQLRMKAITQLKECDGSVAVPLLLTVTKDPDFLVRSFVAMGLGKHRSDDSYEALLEMMKSDKDANVRAEAANSFSFFGETSAVELKNVFIEDRNWLVRRSILAALVDLNCCQELFEVCLSGMDSEDLTVRADAIRGLAFLSTSAFRDQCLEALLKQVDHSNSYIRITIARALGKFSGDEVAAAIAKLRQDENHRVVAAALEGLI